PSILTFSTDTIGRPGSTRYWPEVPQIVTVAVSRLIGTPAAARTASEAASSSAVSVVGSSLVMPRAARSPIVASGSSAILATPFQLSGHGVRVREPASSRWLQHRSMGNRLVLVEIQEELRVQSTAMTS